MEMKKITLETKRSGSDDNNNDKAIVNVLAVPYPSQGHINPMLQFCKRLSSYGLNVNTTLAPSLFISNTFQPNPSPSVQFASISDGFDHGGFASANSVQDYLTRLQSAGSRSLAALIHDRRASGSPIHCVIYDAFLPWALDVAKRFALPAAAFFTQACTVNYVYHLLHHGSLQLPMDDHRSFPLAVDGLRLLGGLRDMPSFVGVAGSYPAYFEMVLSQFSNANQADFVLVNTVYELEEEAVDSMSKAYPLLLTIGPTIPSAYLDKRIQDDKDYGFNLFVSHHSSLSVTKWLDAKPPRSVVYVSFGSMANLSPRQMEELAMGLRSAAFDFLWVVRSGEEAKLPDGFLREMAGSGGKGLIVNWSEQLEVLSHEAVGCFFTHCGWNSTIEALSLGVPMVGMPQWTDQPTDGRLVEALWEVGVRVEVEKESGLVGREEIELRVRQVMESEAMTSNAQKWRDVAVRAVSEGGTSDNNIRQFLSKLRNYNS